MLKTLQLGKLNTFFSMITLPHFDQKQDEIGTKIGQEILKCKRRCRLRLRLWRIVSYSRIVLIIFIAIGAKNSLLSKYLLRNFVHENSHSKS